MVCKAIYTKYYTSSLSPQGSEAAQRNSAKEHNRSMYCRGESSNAVLQAQISRQSWAGNASVVTSIVLHFLQVAEHGYYACVCGCISLQDWWSNLQIRPINLRLSYWPANLKIHHISRLNGTYIHVLRTSTCQQLK